MLILENEIDTFSIKEREREQSIWPYIVITHREAKYCRLLSI